MGYTEGSSTRHQRSRPASGACLALIVAAFTPPALAEKTDIVVLRNGDRVTGEVQQLSYGRLEFKTDDMGTVYIEWDKIASLTTNQQLQVELNDGGRLVGRAPAPSEQPESLRLVADEGAAPSSVPMSAVARLYTLESGKWYRRLEGDVSIGYSFTQSSDVEVLNFGANIGTRNEKRRWNIEVDGQRTTQSAAPASERGSLLFSVERYLPDRYYREGILGLTTNRELGLDLRTVVGGTTGRYLHRSGTSEWRAGLGLALQSEDRTDGTSQQSLEGILTTTYRIFRLDTPKTDLEFTLNVLPSLTESGRWRGEGGLDLRKEFVKDLFLELSLWGAYDNQPTAGASTSDWSIITSLGYSF
jgi:hypothetical protein